MALSVVRISIGCKLGHENAVQANVVESTSLHQKTKPSIEEKPYTRTRHDCSSIYLPERKELFPSSSMKLKNESQHRNSLRD